ncbi:hypothetical protein [Micromonospora sp. CPCC 205558]|uniref:hypothetical protein n=1 Tax=Micromonospora sp. CPCC 205558 TaxID=3122403 RepID=UPI002FF39568
MLSVTFRSPAATEVAVGGAVRVPTATRLKADMRVPVVRTPRIAQTHTASSPMRTGRGPPAESLHIQHDRQGEAIQASALFVFPAQSP